MSFGKTDGENIPQQVSMIFYTVERYSKLQAEEILHQKLLDKPEEFKNGWSHFCQLKLSSRTLSPVKFTLYSIQP